MSVTEEQYRQIVLDPRPTREKSHLDPADTVRLDKFKFINSEFPLETLRIYNSPFEKIRLGRDKDGGYVIVDISQGGRWASYDALISCGINDDDSFEHDFVGFYDVPVFAFDGTVEGLPNKHDKIKFIKKNISDENSETEDNLKGLIAKYKDIFLKMDIEGDEYLWINNLTDDELSKFKQIAIEFHEPYEKYKWRCLERLCKTHWAFHFNPNNCGAVCFHGDTKVPESFEMTYVRKDAIEKTPSTNTTPFPTKLDKPNAPNRPIISYNERPYCAPDFRNCIL